MANTQKDKQRKIERKYGRLIGKTIERMKDNTMDEFCAELNILKSQMANDFEKQGIKLSENK